MGNPTWLPWFHRSFRDFYLWFSPRPARRGFFFSPATAMLSFPRRGNPMWLPQFALNFDLQFCCLHFDFLFSSASDETHLRRRKNSRRSVFRNQFPPQASAPSLNIWWSYLDLFADMVNGNVNHISRRSNMPNKTYIVELTSKERKELKRLINTGKTAAYNRTADQEGLGRVCSAVSRWDLPTGWTDSAGHG